ncbi:hypothetical protein NXS19_005470 [Fusarium pseudograminearum]|nr:hypothetical protein NXS19_005470 [Fusarium pseudograminearum]
MSARGSMSYESLHLPRSHRHHITEPFFSTLFFDVKNSRVLHGLVPPLSQLGFVRFRASDEAETSNLLVGTGAVSSISQLQPKGVRLLGWTNLVTKVSRSSESKCTSAPLPFSKSDQLPDLLAILARSIYEPGTERRELKQGSGYPRTESNHAVDPGHGHGLGETTTLTCGDMITDDKNRGNGG